MSSAKEQFRSTDADKIRAQTFYRAGNDAASKDNFDYAIQMLKDACKLHPENVQFRQSLRGIARKKFNNDPAKVGMLARARQQDDPDGAPTPARTKGNYTQALEVCEEAFANNPWDTGAARVAAEAAEGLGLNVLAQWLVESVAAQATDVEFFKYSAHVHQLNNAWQKAIGAWERVKKINPSDEEANRAINAISASATIHRSGLGEAINKRAASSGPESAKDAELEELKQPQLSPEERWTKEIQEHPTQIGSYLAFAEHLKLRGQLDKAEKVLAEGLKAVPDDPSLKLVYAEVQINRIKLAIGSWQRKLNEHPDDDIAIAKIAKLEAMLSDYEIDEFKRRINLQPTDANLHYEMGIRLAGAGRHKDAIGSFQQAARLSPVVKVDALIKAGLSFEADNVLPLAERMYEEALKSADGGDVATVNNLHYRLGRVAEAMDKRSVAMDHYNEVAANDYSYLDVAQRLRNLS